MAFHRGNQRQAVFSPRAIFFLAGALRGKTAPASDTLTLPRQFRLFSPVIVGVPSGLGTGQTISANLLPPTTPAATGGTLRLQVELGGTGTVPGDGDLLVTQC